VQKFHLVTKIFIVFLLVSYVNLWQEVLIYQDNMTNLKNDYEAYKRLSGQALIELKVKQEMLNVNFKKLVQR
jgi:hypothetical protein